MQDNKPIYLQIADRMMDDILQGRYPVEGRIPSVRELAADRQVNANTIMRSYEQLERDGIIYNKRGLGYFVAERAKEIIKEQRMKQLYAGEMEYIFGRLRSLSITPEKLTELYSKYLDDNA